MDSFNNSVFISLNGMNTKVLILGGGKSALIKAKTLLYNGFMVHCISKEFTDEFKVLDGAYTNLELLDKPFTNELLEDYHLIVICTNDDKFNENIRNICNSKNRIFIDTTLPENSRAVLCATGRSKNIALGLRVKGKNPKASVFLCNKGKEYFESFDNYIEFITHIRNNVTTLNNKNEILNFICSEDFLFFFNHGYHIEILKLFYSDLLNKRGIDLNYTMNGGV
ncbi:NAD(P)-dependent oxidoreductase [Clostridium sp.]|uniref:NAD(P)-dependent oxidoreductase n=1 Tax=Clostridium sp. TaxID=1506 RepID=UPI0032178A99